MRIRTVKPEFWSSYDTGQLCDTAALVAIGLLNMSDDEGFFLADERVVKSTLFPLRDPDRAISECLDELEAVGYIQRRISANGKTYGLVVNFRLHQRVNRPTPSKTAIIFEECEYAHGDLSEDSVSDHGGLTAGKEGKGKEGKGKEQSAGRSVRAQLCDLGFGSLDKKQETETLLKKQEKTGVTDQQIMDLLTERAGDLKWRIGDRLPSTPYSGKTAKHQIVLLLEDGLTMDDLKAIINYVAHPESWNAMNNCRGLTFIFRPDKAEDLLAKTKDPPWGRVNGKPVLTNEQKIEEQERKYAESLKRFGGGVAR